MERSADVFADGHLVFQYIEISAVIALPADDAWAIADLAWTVRRHERRTWRRTHSGGVRAGTSLLLRAAPISDSLGGDRCRDGVSSTIFMALARRHVCIRHSSGGRSWAALCLCQTDPGRCQPVSSVPL